MLNATTSTQMCTTVSGSPITTIKCYEPTDVYFCFLIEFVICFSVLCIGIYLICNKKK